ncbi:unnamed protein product, partial [Ectocarpus sp. 8 AP-2014]
NPSSIPGDVVSLLDAPTELHCATPPSRCRLVSVGFLLPPPPPPLVFLPPVLTHVTYPPATSHATPPHTHDEHPLVHPCETWPGPAKTRRIAPNPGCEANGLKTTTTAYVPLPPVSRTRGLTAKVRNF